MVHNNVLDMKVLGWLVDDTAKLWREGRKVVIVTSGAVALGGVGKSGDVGVAAGKGMHKIVNVYDHLFRKYRMGAMEVLLNRNDFERAAGRSTLTKRIDNASIEDIIAIVNENDVMSTVETTLGDNDALAARVACTINADTLILLSMENSNLKGKGGGNSKIDAIKMVESHNISALLVEGKGKHILRETIRDDTRGKNNVLRLKAMLRT